MQLEVHAFEHGYSVVLGNTTSNPELERTYLHSLLERQVDGLLFLGGLTNHPRPEPESLRIVQEVAERVPVVAVNGDLPNVDLLSSVSSDEEGGMRQVLRHLRERGHTRIAFLGGQEDVTSSLAKLRVYREFCPAAPDTWVHFTGLTIQAGVNALGHLLRAPERPTALVCINDLVAAGVLQAARAAGMAVPETFSVVGFDDVFPAQIVSPPLTSVSHNYSRLAREAIQVLLAGIAGQRAARTLVVPTILVQRQSVGPPSPTG
ncbi:substrate-binding domain-containing protein [Deinococcus sp. YIM 77859]|uniref:substrate-binding domain-containing protein n=1 Tax=Deinococcus sp. YIM 77859 TaxID=1540221 RepID=UPI001E2D175B|nr:substrate-binding domain-containing protein [Deinococcus sp. YIM 77859]